MCVCVYADEFEKSTGPIFKIHFATDSDRFALGHCQINTDFFLSQPISSNWMILNLHIKFDIIGKISGRKIYWLKFYQIRSYTFRDMPQNASQLR